MKYAVIPKLMEAKSPSQVTPHLQKKGLFGLVVQNVIRCIINHFLNIVIIAANKENNSKSDNNNLSLTNKKNCTMSEKINIEDYARRRKTIPVGMGYEYELRVNKEQLITISKRFVTAKEILELAGKNADQTQLCADYGNGRILPVANNETIDLTQGVIKFITTPLQAVNG